jgi:DNA polymerase III alpha subunit
VTLLLLTLKATRPTRHDLPRLLRRRQWEQASDTLDRLRGIFGRDNVAVEVNRTLTEGEHTFSQYLFDLADTSGIQTIATNNVHHVSKVGFSAHEALRRVALHLSPDQEDGRLPMNGERYLISPQAMQRLFGDRPDALENSLRLAERLAAPLDPSAYLCQRVQCRSGQEEPSTSRMW